MKKSYTAPHIEAIEIELEDVILAASVEDLSDGGTLGDWE